MTALIILIVLSVIFVALLGFCVYVVVKSRQQFQDEMSYSSDIYAGPSGEPLWNGKLPEKVDDYTVPRYVYENLVESTEYLPENGRIIGYRISPTLVIHSRIKELVNPPVLLRYVERYGGKMLNDNDAYVLSNNWNEIMALREKAGDIKLKKLEWCWIKHNGYPVAMNIYRGVYKDLICIPDAWEALILKR